jgi:hypothetical protein
MGRDLDREAAENALVNIITQGGAVSSEICGGSAKPGCCGKLARVAAILAPLLLAACVAPPPGAYGYHPQWGLPMPMPANALPQQPGASVALNTPKGFTTVTTIEFFHATSEGSGQRTPCYRVRIDTNGVASEAVLCVGRDGNLHPSEETGQRMRMGGTNFGKDKGAPGGNAYDPYYPPGMMPK